MVALLALTLKPALPSLLVLPSGCAVRVRYVRRFFVVERLVSLYRTFTHLARNTSQHLNQAYRDEALSQRAMHRFLGTDTGFTRSQFVVASPIGSGGVLREEDLGADGSICTPVIAQALQARLEQILPGPFNEGLVEGLRFLGSDGAPGWFFYGWAAVS